MREQDDQRNDNSDLYYNFQPNNFFIHRLLREYQKNFLGHLHNQSAFDSQYHIYLIIAISFYDNSENTCILSNQIFEV